MAKKADFTIQPGATIWRHSRAFKAGNERELNELGFPDEQKQRKHDTRQIVWDNAAKADAQAAPAKATPAKTTPASEVDTTDAAAKLAKENGLDIATVTGTGADGRVTKADVEAAVKAAAEAKTGA